MHTVLLTTYQYNLVSFPWTSERLIFTGYHYILNRIIDTLPIVLEDWKVAEIPGFEENFPHSIRLSQTIAVWKFIIQYPQTLL